MIQIFFKDDINHSSWSKHCWMIQGRLLMFWCAYVTDLWQESREASVSESPLCPSLFCVRVFFVSESSLCPSLFCVRAFLVCNHVVSRLILTTSRTTKRLFFWNIHTCKVEVVVAVNTFFIGNSSAWDFAQKLSNSLAIAQPQIDVLLSNQLIFAKSCINQP